MSLVSVQFAAFVAIAAVLFQFSAQERRPALLVGLSILFCALNSIAAACALLAATACAFYAARWIDSAIGERHRRVLLGAAVTILLGHLVLVKLRPYMPIAASNDWLPQALVAFGASFYTLKLIGYLVDVFWRRYAASVRLTEFAAFATFFPLLPAGPIQRPNEFRLPTDNGEIAQLMIYGLRRILLGLVKKLLVADRLGGIVDYIAGGQPEHANLLWVMAYLFPLQLYADFSALTDIAIGTAALFGVRTPENFSFPFFAASISEFWRRWHMSLTRWLGDYVFAPLRMAMRSLGSGGLVISIVVNMALIGMWHAISYGWLLFGLINAVFLIIDVLTARMRKRIYKKSVTTARIATIIGPMFVFHMIAFSLVCYRAQTLPDIEYFFGNLLNGVGSPVRGLSQLFYSYGRGTCTFAFAALCGFIVLECWLYGRARGWTPIARLPRFGELPRAARWAVYYVGLLAVGIASQQGSRFIYVQF